MKFLLFFLLLLTNLLNSPVSSDAIINNSDMEALISVKDCLTDMPGTYFFSTWNISSQNPCFTFSGVICDPETGRVTALSLGTGLSGSHGLSGSLSPALSNLTALTQLILFPGLVTGPIPPQLSQLTNLKVISFTNNRLTGPIPESFSLLRNLHTLDLTGNQLSGSIPPGLTQLPNLKILILASNRISGNLTRVSSRLLHLDLKRNEISGRLPASLPTTLRYLSVGENSMWGRINVLESLKELIYLDLSMNKFSGPITISLSSMLLKRHSFTGNVVPTSEFVGQPYDQVSTVDLSHNFFTGDLPRALAGVESLFLNHNFFTGEVPEEYVESLANGTIKTLFLQHNYITGFPLLEGATLPDTASLCLSYNCMQPVIGQSMCPANAGIEIARPASQCSAFRNQSTKL